MAHFKIAGLQRRKRQNPVGVPPSVTGQVTKEYSAPSPRASPHAVRCWHQQTRELWFFEQVFSISFPSEKLAEVIRRQCPLS